MLKILLYNLSLLPLYIIYIIKTINIYLLCDLDISLKWYEIILDFILLMYKPLIFIILSIVGISTIVYFKYQTNIDNGLGSKIKFFERINYEHLTFLATFILPVFAIGLETINDMIVLFFILFFMGIVYIKSGMYYLNPIFLMFGWYLYKIKMDDKELVALSTFKLDNNSNFIEKKIDENFIFIQKV